MYINLQRSQAETTAGLLYALAEQIAAGLREAHWRAPALSPRDAYDAEPFLAYDSFLQSIERDLASDKRVLLVFDEFEELETQVNAGQIDRRIFAFMRGVTQTGRGFVLVFAGLHTLEQMTHDYWHPFFLSVKPIKVGYLGESDARQLITDPIDQFPLQYDDAAVERILATTRGQPYLVQDLCHNLVTHLNDPLHRSNRAAVEDVDAVLGHTLESGTYYFDDYVWGWSGENERLALAVIAALTPFPPPTSPLGEIALGKFEDSESGKDTGVVSKGGWVIFSAVEKHLGRDAALAALKNLCARDILEERAVGEMLAYRFQVELSRLWVARTKPLARILLERK